MPREARRATASYSTAVDGAVDGDPRTSDVVPSGANNARDADIRRGTPTGVRRAADHKAHAMLLGTMLQTVDAEGKVEPFCPRGAERSIWSLLKRICRYVAVYVSVWWFYVIFVVYWKPEWSNLIPYIAISNQE